MVVRELSGCLEWQTAGRQCLLDRRTGPGTIRPMGRAEDVATVTARIARKIRETREECGLAGPR